MQQSLDNSPGETGTSEAGGRFRLTDPSLPTINELMEREAKIMLSPDEQEAVNNFGKYRITELQKQTCEEDFFSRYETLEVMANTVPYTEFLGRNGFNRLGTVREKTGSKNAGTHPPV